MPYRIAARGEEIWSALARDAAGAQRSAERRFRKRAMIVYALASLAIASAGFVVLLDVRLDYAHRERDPGAGMCGPGLVTCPTGETCVFDDYSHVLPIGNCELPCRRKYQMCSRTFTPRECLYVEDATQLECVRVYGSGLR